MSIVEFDGSPFRFLDASKTGESTKYPWVGVVEGTAGGKHRETITTSLCHVFKGRGRVMALPLIKSINNLVPWRKNLSNQGNIISITCRYAVVNNYDNKVQIRNIFK